MKIKLSKFFTSDLHSPALQSGYKEHKKAYRPKQILNSKTTLFSLVAGLTYSLVPAADASVTVLFPDGSPFDGGGVGASQSLTDGAFTFNISTVDIIGSDGKSNVVDMATNSTNIFSSLGLGINTASVAGAESQNFDIFEAWIFKFSNNVNFDGISITSFTSGQIVNLTFLDGSNSGAGTNYNLSASDSAINYSYTADTPIRFRLDGVGSTTDDNVRIGSLTVTAVPEPTSALLLGVLLVLSNTALRSRRQAA